MLQFKSIYTLNKKHYLSIQITSQKLSIEKFTAFSTVSSNQFNKELYVPSSIKEGIFSYATSNFNNVSRPLSIRQRQGLPVKASNMIKKVTKQPNKVNLINNREVSENGSIGDRKQIILRTASNRISYFSRRGNQPRRERNFQTYFKSRALLYKKEKKRTPIAYFPSFFYAATPFIRLKTRRRGSRRARLRQKVTFISRHAGERQGYLLFVKAFRSSAVSRGSGSEKNSFRSKLQSQRESLFKTAVSRRRDLNKAKALAKQQIQNKSKFNKNNKLGYKKKPKLRDLKSAVKYALNRKKTSTSAKSLQEIRNEIHRRAFSVYPGIWSWKKRKKKKIKNKRLQLYKAYSLRSYSVLRRSLFRNFCHWPLANSLKH